MEAWVGRGLCGPFSHGLQEDSGSKFPPFLLSVWVLGWVRRSGRMEGARSPYPKSFLEARGRMPNAGVPKQFPGFQDAPLSHPLPLTYLRS